MVAACSNREEKRHKVVAAFPMVFRRPHRSKQIPIFYSRSRPKRCHLHNVILEVLKRHLPMVFRSLRLVFLGPPSSPGPGKQLRLKQLHQRLLQLTAAAAEPAGACQIVSLGRNSQID